MVNGPVPGLHPWKQLLPTQNEFKYLGSLSLWPANAQVVRLRHGRRERQTCQRLVCSAASAAGAAGDGMAAPPEGRSLLARADAFLSAFWKFLRPHTIRGTILGSFAVTARVLIESPVVRWPELCQGVRVSGRALDEGILALCSSHIDSMHWYPQLW